MKAFIVFALIAVSAIAAQAQGTIQFFNSALSRLYYIDNLGNVLTGAAVPGGFHIGTIQEIQ